MIKVYKNDGCCKLPCIGDCCPYRNQKVVACDICRQEISETYFKRAGKEYCEDCLKEFIIDNFEDLILHNDDVLEDLEIERID